jgi:hypothetical protein
VIAEDLPGFFLFAILLTVATFISLTEKKSGNSTAKEHHPTDIRAFKKCPGCAEELPLSTLVCDACEYNFLSGSIGSKYKLLPAPDAERLSA